MAPTLLFLRGIPGLVTPPPGVKLPDSFANTSSTLTQPDHTSYFPSSISPNTTISVDDSPPQPHSGFDKYSLLGLMGLGYLISVFIAYILHRIKKKKDRDAQDLAASNAALRPDTNSSLNSDTNTHIANDTNSNNGSDRALSPGFRLNGRDLTILRTERNDGNGDPLPDLGRVRTAPPTYEPCGMSWTDQELTEGLPGYSENRTGDETRGTVAL
ncbi:uncharacterized protein RSE6_05188 [Rhynchosporium secalis]|uniref:Uncharacterized protein n=1 Tax=Rhynchosporium secalis TaxID=38038 RepID=A0A1E1M754_RHYSE|nr:uncharacterized protein RSE6_05188 [Rhynchosporium secalis]